MAMDYSRAADWIVAEDSFDPEYLGKCESIMCQGNGYLCLRNATDEFNPSEQRDLFVAGTFNKFDDNEVTELPNAADISRLDLRLDGVRFSLLTGKVESYDRALNLKTGETTRRVVWAAPNGKRYQLMFDQAYIFSNGSGGPANSTLTVSLMVYRYAFGTTNAMGYAACIAIILALVIMAVSMIAEKLNNAERWY